MQFSEHEMTVAVDAVARELFLSRKLPWRRKKGAAEWAALPAFTRYQHKAAAGEMILPTLAALPEASDRGARSFSMKQVTQAAEAGARGLAEQRTPGSWDALAPKKRQRLVRLTALLTQRALSAMPPRPPAAGSARPEAD